MIIKTLTLSALALLTSCSACSGPDFTPLGNGLTAIGICLVANGVVRSLAELVGTRKPGSAQFQQKEES